MFRLLILTALVQIERIVYNFRVYFYCLTVTTRTNFIENDSQIYDTLDMRMSAFSLQAGQVCTAISSNGST